VCGGSEGSPAQFAKGIPGGTGSGGGAGFVANARPRTDEELTDEKPRRRSVVPRAGCFAPVGEWRPVNFDAETYKGRNTVERSFSLFKQWRAGVVLYAVLIWFRQ
jgi:hypothetical protein